MIEVTISGGICITPQDNIAVCAGEYVSLWSLDGLKLGEFGQKKFKWCRGICVDQMGRYSITKSNRSFRDMITLVHLLKHQNFQSPWGSGSQPVAPRLNKSPSTLRTWAKCLGWI